MRTALTVLFLTALVSAGCTDYDSGGRSAAPEATGVAVDPFSMGDPAQPPPEVVEASEPVEPGMVREEAASGAGKKGQYGPGLIKTPLATYWRAKERITYEAQVKHSLNIYHGMHGHYPKTKEDFEREILKPANVQLPELPEGHRYVYDPENGELLVERPG